MDPIKDNLGVEMEYTPAQAHVPPAERNNRTIKEMFRVGLHRVPYKTIPKAMIISLCEYGTNMLNMFPARHGISDYYSPSAIVTGKALDYSRHCQFEFGSYVQAGQETNPRNTPKERRLDAIYLRPSDTQRGGHVVMNLSTGKEVTRNVVTPIPLPDSVKTKVEKLATKQGFTTIKFTNKKGVELINVDWIAGVDYDEYYQPTQTDEPDELDELDDDDEYVNPTNNNNDNLYYDEEIDEEEIDDLNNDHNTNNNDDIDELDILQELPHVETVTDDDEDEGDPEAEYDMNRTDEEKENDEIEDDNLSERIDNLQQEFEEEIPENLRRSERSRQPDMRLTYDESGNAKSKPTYAQIVKNKVDDNRKEQDKKWKRITSNTTNNHPYED